MEGKSEGELKTGKELLNDSYPGNERGALEGLKDTVIK